MKKMTTKILIALLYSLISLYRVLQTIQYLPKFIRAAAAGTLLRPLRTLPVAGCQSGHTGALALIVDLLLAAPLLAQTPVRAALGGVGRAGAVTGHTARQTLSGSTGVEQGARGSNQAARTAGRLTVGAGAVAGLAGAQAFAVAGVVELGNLAARIACHHAGRAGSLVTRRRYTVL